MPLSHESRRRDKDYILPDRVPKLFLSRQQLDALMKRYPHIRVLTHKGKPHVDITEFKSCSFLLNEAEKTTRELHSFCLIKFFRWRNALPDDLIEEYKRDSDLAARDISAFVSSNRGRVSDKYLERIVYTVRTWLYVNGIEIPSEVLRKKYRIRFKPGSIPDTPPTRGELRKILLASSTVWRAVFSFLSATGLRPAEAITLRIGDLEPHPYDAAEAEEVITVNVPGTLTKKDFSYTTFAHPECARFLSDFLKEIERKGIDVEDPDAVLFYNSRSSKGFYMLNSVEVAWNRVLKKLGLDERIIYPSRNIRTRHLYTLRKFFRTNLEAAGVPFGAVEAMLGHKQWYVRFTKERLKEFYIKGMWALMVLTSPSLERVEEIVEASIKPLQEELEKLKKQKEEDIIRREAEARELVKKLADILRRRPELLRELLGEL